MENKIYSASLEATGTGPIETVVSTGLRRVAGLCVDWIHNYLFWTDEDWDRVERYNINTNKRTAVINTNLHSPRGIAVDPLSSPGY